MHRAFSKPIQFRNPATGGSVVLTDTSSAVMFLSTRWKWDRGVGFFAAARACLMVMDEFDDPENARAAVVFALKQVGIPVD
ncbi:DUF982 domain-containing protein [Falsirhodobacter xinxiangensis]|uniref:DUF982 domain-containing protein n=1 Tax=Falsirhodobacter xinxiangensis TaxID=2530049 RepID=UPI0010A99F46|nr:DUF982 domain-containing protein [Rhodobacter xinxiangensis]